MSTRAVYGSDPVSDADMPRSASSSSSSAIWWACGG